MTRAAVAMSCYLMRSLPIKSRTDLTVSNLQCENRVRSGFCSELQRFGDVWLRE